MANYCYRVKQCSKCPGDTAYFCTSCQCDMCSNCKEYHVNDLKTIDHHVVTYRKKFDFPPSQTNSNPRSDHACKENLESCKIPDCSHCKNKKKHAKTASDTEQQLYNRTIHFIRSESLFNRSVLMTGIKADIEKCQKNIPCYQSETVTKAQTLQNLIDYVQNDSMYNVFCDFDFKHRCLKQFIKMYKHISSMQKFEQRLERSAVSPVKFLRKKSHLPKLQDSPNLKQHTKQLSMTESINKRGVMKILNDIKITERGVRQVKAETVLTLMACPEFHQSFELPHVDCCRHISHVTSDRMWVSDDENNLILTNTEGVTIHLMDDACGVEHTVNNESELVYVDKDHNLKKLSNDLQTTTIILEKNEIWRPLCMCCSLSTGDLLVGIYRYGSHIGSVIRFNHARQCIQEIQTGAELPCSVIENNNGDVIFSLGYFDLSLSGYGFVEVKEGGGGHRFAYSGHGSRFKPQGICTDALSHILICDAFTLTVQILSKDGEFLSHLLIRPPGIISPCCLSYDVDTHRLYVGSEYGNKLSVYRFISRQISQTDQHLNNPNGMDLPNEIQPREKPEEGNECKLIAPPFEDPISFKLKDIQNCVHISCMTTDRAWLSDLSDNLTLTNTAGGTLRHVQDLCHAWDFYEYHLFPFIAGVHTVNNKGELIYISKDYSIKKLSNDMKTTITFVQETDKTWDPYCVYASLSAGDLFVGMYRKVARYNHEGQLVQTIQYDETGLEMFLEPHYITENNNGDVVVSDCSDSGAVVVTDREGRYRFSYTGHPPGSGLVPSGICTDEQSNILVCDIRVIHILDSFGQFRSHLKVADMFFIDSLCYDVHSRRLWIGSMHCKEIFVYSQRTRHGAIADGSSNSPDEVETCAQSQQV